MSAAPDQLVLDLPQGAALGVQDFLVSSANAAAPRMIDRWPHWPEPAVLMVAPAGAGKSHLANVWRLKSAAVALAAQHLREADAERSVRALLVEDLHDGIGHERVLFHLLNLAREHGRSMLLTSRLAPGALPVRLPDLRSRLRALPVIAIAPPDAPLSRAVLVKPSADRPPRVDPRVTAPLALHMEQWRGPPAALVAELARQAMALPRPITRGLAGEILARGRSRHS